MNEVPIPENKPQPEVENDQVLPPAATMLAKDSAFSPFAKPSNSWDAMLKQLGAGANAGILDEHAKG